MKKKDGACFLMIPLLKESRLIDANLLISIRNLEEYSLFSSPFKATFLIGITLVQ